MKESVNSNRHAARNAEASLLINFRLQLRATCQAVMQGLYVVGGFYS